MESVFLLKRLPYPRKKGACLRKQKNVRALKRHVYENLLTR